MLLLIARAARGNILRKKETDSRGMPVTDGNIDSGPQSASQVDRNLGRWRSRFVHSRFVIHDDDAEIDVNFESLVRAECQHWGSGMLLFAMLQVETEYQKCCYLLLRKIEDFDASVFESERLSSLI